MSGSALYSRPLRKTRPGPVVLASEGLVKKYGSRTVVNGVSFEVHEGEVVGLLGPNGAGKTTSFRMTCGLIRADGGHVELGGEDVTQWPMYRRAREGKMGYLPQDRAVFGSLSTEKNLYLAMEMLGIPRREQKRRCDGLLELFHLTKVRRSTVGMGGTGGLSGGERRRLEIARALLAEPRILLLDEPFANVDPNTITEIQQVVRHLADEGYGVLITDHQIDATMEIAHYCYVIVDGEVLTSGTPIEVLAHEEARKSYFGEKSQQQLENLRKKIAQEGLTRGESIPFSKNEPRPQRKPVQTSEIAETNSPRKSRQIRPEGFVVEDAEDLAEESYQVGDDEVLPPPDPATKRPVRRLPERRTPRPTRQPFDPDDFEELPPPNYRR